MKPEDIMENEEEIEVVTLEDDDGNEREFELAGNFDYLGEEYVALIPLEDDGEAVVFIKTVPSEEDDEETFETVVDPELLDKLFEVFKEEFADVFDFED